MIRHATDETLQDLLNSEGPTLIKCGAPWCGPCKTYDDILKRIDSDFPQADIVVLDVEACPASATRLGISKVPYTVIMKDGKAVEDCHGLIARPKILSMLGLA